MAMFIHVFQNYQNVTWHVFLTMLEVSENDEMAWRMPEKCDWNRLDVVKYGKMCKNQAGLNIAILSRKNSWYDDVGLKYSFETSPVVPKIQTQAIQKNVCWVPP